MLDVALDFLRDELVSYIAARTGSDRVPVKLTRIVEDTGKYAFAPDAVALTLINVEEERTVRAQLPTHSYTNGQHVVQEPELKLNLYALVAAHFRVYEEGLKYLSYVMTYFQSHPYFTAAQYPGLDPSIEKLVVELQSLGYEQLNQVWGFVGGKQLPSAVYRIRMVVLQDRTPAGIRPPLTAIDTTLTGR